MIYIYIYSWIFSPHRVWGNLLVLRKANKEHNSVKWGDLVVRKMHQYQQQQQQQQQQLYEIQETHLFSLNFFLK